MLDGYTEQTYGAHVNELAPLLERRYWLVGDVPGPVHTVKVYALTAEARHDRDGLL